MSTFVVRFLEVAAGAFRGKVRHVRSGEERVFASPSELIDFFERLHASSRIETGGAGLDGEVGTPDTDPTPSRSKGDPVQDR